MKLDKELARIHGILKLLEEAENRLYTLKRDLGDRAFTRSKEYIYSRMKWFVDDLSKKNE